MAKKTNPAENSGQEEKTNLPAVAGAGSTAVSVAGPREMVIPGSGIVVEEVASVTRPVLKQTAGVPFFVTIQSAVYVGKEIEGVKRDGTTREKPADLMNVLDLQDGSEKLLIANAVMKAEIERAYPDNTYVGKSFAVLGFEPDATKGKRYRTYSIKEIRIAGGKAEKVADVATPPTHGRVAGDAAKEAA